MAYSHSTQVNLGVVFLRFPNQDAVIGRHSDDASDKRKRTLTSGHEMICTALALKIASTDATGQHASFTLSANGANKLGQLCFVQPGLNARMMLR